MVSFFRLSRQAAFLLSSRGVVRGDHVTHFFSSNSVGDLAFRLGSALIGVVPVTVNWQADSVDKVLYKHSLTRAKLFVVDNGTKKDGLGGSAVILDVDEDLLSTEKRASNPELPTCDFCVSTAASDTRIVIFTSGTTGDPKGVCLPYSSYVCNQESFDSFLAPNPSTPLIAVVVNPMHHTNSTAITDWCLRRPGATLHLVSRYTS